MVSEIEEVDEVTESRDQNASSASPSTAAIRERGNDESLREDVYTAAAYGDVEKLQRLVESEGHSLSKPDALGYYPLQWAALNNRIAPARYILEVMLSL